MRKLVAGLFITLDNVTDGPERWQGPFMDQEVGQHLGSGLAAADALILGRRTYEEWVRYWPTADNPFAAQINGIKKFVVSATLDGVDWGESEQISADVLSRIEELKGQAGGDLLINGSATLVRSLLDAGLLDELSLLVHPVIVGGDKRLFDGLKPANLQLAEATPFGNGVVALAYRPSDG